jgi:hypothetical protein
MIQRVERFGCAFPRSQTDLHAIVDWVALATQWVRKDMIVIVEEVIERLTSQARLEVGDMTTLLTIIEMSRIRPVTFKVFISSAIR